MANTDHRGWIEEHPCFWFMLANGVFGVVAGLLMVFADRRVVASGWACLVIGCGAVLLAGAALIGFDIEVSPGPDTLAVAIVVVGLFAIAALYLTHPAEDLPRLLPGHDGDSQHLRTLYGAVTAAVASIAVRIAYLSASPRRQPI